MFHDWGRPRPAPARPHGALNSHHYLATASRPLLPSLLFHLLLLLLLSMSPSPNPHFLLLLLLPIPTMTPPSFYRSIQSRQILPSWFKCGLFLFNLQDMKPLTHTHPPPPPPHSLSVPKPPFPSTTSPNSFHGPTFFL